MWKRPGRSSRSCYQFFLLATSLSKHVAACTALVCRAQCSMPVRLGHWQSQPPTSAAEWQGNNQTDLQCQAARHCHHQVQWATCAAWHWGPGPHLKERRLCWYDKWNAPTVQSSQPVTYRLMESWAWEAQGDMESADRERLQSGSSRLLTLMIDTPGEHLEIWCEICHACSKPASWKGAHWCGFCPCTCMLIKNQVMMMVKCFSEVLLMSTHNVCLCGEVRIKMSKLFGWKKCLF